MNPKTTLFLVLLTAASIGGLRVLRRVQPENGPAVAASAAVSFAGRELRGIEVTDPDGERLLGLKRDQYYWLVTHPYEDVADPEHVERLLEDLASLEIVELLNRKEFADADWKATGLDGPKTRVMAAFEDGQTIDLALASPGVMEGTCYAVVTNPAAGKPPFYVVLRSGMPALLKEGPALWRDMKLLRLPADAITGVRLRTDSTQIQLQRNGAGRDPWRLVKPLQTRASTLRVTDLLALALNLRILRVDAAGDGNAVARAAPQEDFARVTLEAGEQTFELVLGRPPKSSAGNETGAPAGVAATASHRGAVYQIALDGLEEFWSDPNALRDTRLASIEETATQAFGIISTAFPELEVKKENELWMVRRHGRWEPANGDRVGRFFNALNESRILEFTADAAADLSPYGLDKPFLRVWWQGGEGGARSSLLVGAVEQPPAMYAKLESEPFIYRVSAELLPPLSAEPLKWKGRGVLRFSQFDLASITLAIGAAPPVELRYDPASAQWSGTVADQDLTAAIDHVKADQLAGSLGSLSADDWSTAIAEGLEALKEPAVRIRIRLRGEDGAPEGGKAHDLVFAPTQPGQDTAFYFGRLDEQPDVFYITRESLRGLLVPVLKER
jgi:hypothetical protein